MNNESNIVHGFKLRVVGDNGPTIFCWPIIPEYIQEIQTMDSGGAKVTVKLPNEDIITCEVLESKEEVESRITECKELDQKCRGAHGN